MIATLTHDFETLLSSNTSLIAIESGDEARVIELIKKLAVKYYRPVFRWSATDGLMAFASTFMAPKPTLDDPASVLREIRKRADKAIYLLCDFAPYLNDTKILRLIKDIVLYHKDATLILLDPNIAVPADLKYKMAHFSIAIPNSVQLQNLINREARSWYAKRVGEQFDPTRPELLELAKSLKGFAGADAVACIENFISGLNVLSTKDSNQSNVKTELLNGNSLLSYEFEPVSSKNLGGATAFKRWLKSNITRILQNKPDQPAIRAAIFGGVSGCGKTMAARAMAGALNIPLLKLTPKFLLARTNDGMSEHFENILHNGVEVSPAIVLLEAVDLFLEEEKSEELVVRFIQFVHWHFKLKTQLFLIVTCDKFDNLPAEIYSDNMISEKIVFEKPDLTEREQIVRIHLSKRSLTSFQIDPAVIAQYSEGLTGSQLEQALIMALHRFKTESQELTTDMVVTALEHIELKDENTNYDFAANVSSKLLNADMD